MRKFSEEHKRKISDALKGKKHSKKRIQNMSNALKGRIISEEWKKNISKGGKKYRLEHPEFMENISKRTSGSGNPNWKGGISFEKYGQDWTDDLRESIRKRDNYICQLCGIHQDELTGLYKKLDVHHIEYNKDDLNPNKLITLCRSCHVKTNYNREYWRDYFEKEIKPKWKI